MLVVDLPSASGPASVAAGIASAGGTAEGFDCDVSQGADIKAMIGRAVELWGRLDIVVNNAMWMGKGGPAGGIQGNAVELEEESWDYAFAVGIKSQYLATKHAVPEMIKVGGGTIVNISSVEGALMSRRNLAYATVKRAVSRPHPARRPITKVNRPPLFRGQHWALASGDGPDQPDRGGLWPGRHPDQRNLPWLHGPSSER